MDHALVETLLRMTEGDTLDFKRQQYPFRKATDPEKAELVKDILAMANAWKNSDAYILVGVDEKPGGRGRVLGVSEHLEDADLQQLFKDKTNRPLRFQYIPLTVDELPVGAIKVSADQERPVFLRRNFGGLKANVVYVRRGSSTVEANPDEVAAMGTGPSPRRPPRSRWASPYPRPVGTLAKSPRCSPGCCQRPNLARTLTRWQQKWKAGASREDTSWRSPH